MKVRVKIEESLSLYVEKLFFEFNAEMKILKYLLSQKEVNKDYLDSYYTEAKNKNIELEITKKEVADQYRPDEKFKNYEFDFETSEIIFMEGGCHS